MRSTRTGKSPSSSSARCGWNDSTELRRSSRQRRVVMALPCGLTATHISSPLAGKDAGGGKGHKCPVGPARQDLWVRHNSVAEGQGEKVRQIGQDLVAKEAVWPTKTPANYSES